MAGLPVVDSFDNSEADFAAFVRAHSTALHRTAYLLTGDRYSAQDAVQTALVSIYGHWAQRESWNNPAAYAHRVVTRVVLQDARRFWRRERPTGRLPERASAADFEHIDQRDTLRRALMGLPVRQRTAVVLRHYLDLSEQDTAQVMHCPTGSVKSLTSRGLRALRRDLGDATS